MPRGRSPTAGSSRCPLSQTELGRRSRVRGRRPPCSDHRDWRPEVSGPASADGPFSVFSCWLAWPVLALLALPCSTSPNVNRLTFCTLSCGAIGMNWICFCSFRFVLPPLGFWHPQWFGAGLQSHRFGGSGSRTAARLRLRPRGRLAVARLRLRLRSVLTPTRLRRRTAARVARSASSCRPSTCSTAGSPDPCWRCSRCPARRRRT